MIWADENLVGDHGARYVDSYQALQEIVADMRAEIATGHRRCCLDTEADSLHHYSEKLCLIQLAYSDRFALIDPLAIPDMSPLLAVLDELEVWFHGADYDLTLFRKTYNWVPACIRDTQIAARLTGSRQFGLAALVEQHFGKTLSKASQKADWSRRPLPPVMLSYAVDDVRYLLPLADKLIGQLEILNRLPWFQQSCDALRKSVTERTAVIREEPWRVQGSGRLHPRGLAALKALWEWRDTVAMGRDIPCFRVMSNKQLVEVALALEAGRELPPPNGWRPRWKQEYRQVVEGVLASPESSWPKRQRNHGGRLTEKARLLLDKLCGEREKSAAELELEPSLLGSKSVLEQIVSQPEAISELMAWQYDVLRGPIDAARDELGFNNSII
ncbi:MAG: HRDC domain-containing protein [Verrucomicrobiaceae bacterium]|nr:HRDC domain-containing protein [Verrucomicrobiaceae bacterium]